MTQLFGCVGSKYRIAHQYPEPLYNTIIEPFAGSMGYSTYWYLQITKLNIIGVDIDLDICDKLNECRSKGFLYNISNGSYDIINNQEATWFIDAPYQALCYHKFHDINYVELAQWCRSRRGQVIVCEQDGANWLPFRTFRSVKNRYHNYSHEVIWTN
jgi:hypothetical protein